MEWFEEQLKVRSESDISDYVDSINSIADAITGQVPFGFTDRNPKTVTALDDIIRFFHIKIRKKIVLPEGLSFEEKLEYTLHPYGVIPRKVMLDNEWFKKAIGPMMAALKSDGTYVALIPNQMVGYHYFDPKTGDKINITRKNQDIFDMEGWCFYKSLPNKSLSMKDLFVYLLKQLQASDIIFYVGLILLSSLLGLLSPLFTKWLTGNILESGSIRVLLAMAVFMISFSISTLCLSSFQGMINQRMVNKQDVLMQAAFMQRVLSLPPAFFREYSSGELFDRVEAGNSLCSTIFNSVASTSIKALFSLVYIGQIFAFAPALAIPAIIIILATVLCSIFFTLAKMSITHKTMEENAKVTGITFSTITGVQKIKLSGSEHRMFSRWGRSYSKVLKLSYNPPVLIKLENVITTLISLGGVMIMYFLSVKTHVAVPDYFAFNTSYAMLMASFMTFSGMTSIIAAIKPKFRMIKPILEAAPEIKEDREVITNISGKIELSHISFRYEENMPYVLDDFSLTIEPGEYIAVVGTTGCGKSTLLRLMLGLETPQKGAVYYDGKDLSRMDLSFLRRSLGVVMQNGKLIHGDIYSNIAISSYGLSMEDAWKAAETACIADDIRKMPMGMHTLISEGEGGVSGGQKQRLLIARAIANKPKALLFDEATSALDNITQKKISDALDSLNCTRIVVAHRLSTIKHCDRIIMLHEGKIIEDGTFEELMNNNGAFARLVARQELKINNGSDEGENQ